jgi:hypothetical protein
MNFITKFFHEMLHPHCEHCEQEKLLNREDKLSERSCKSCESLRYQLETLMHEKNVLLNAVLEKDEKPEPIPVDTSKLQPIRPFAMPWNARRQLLEAEDREKAKLLVKAKTDMTAKLNDTVKKLETEIKTDVEQLEKELGVAVNGST